MEKRKGIWVNEERKWQTAGDWKNPPKIEDLIGKTFSAVEVDETKTELVFVGRAGETSYMFYHRQDCCESVHINDIVGDLNDLVGMPILGAEESTSGKQADIQNYGTETWTFYKFFTRKGYVDIRWFGSSNGYYGESVDFVGCELRPEWTAEEQQCYERNRDEDK